MSNPRRLITLLSVGCVSFGLIAERPLNVGPGRDQVRTPKATSAVDPDQDNATLRRAAMREWWGEYTPEYRQFLMGVAQREREHWGNLIPGAGSGHLLPTKAVGNHWTSIGPTTASYEWNGSSYSAIDSGRPVAIVVDPTDANIIYNATAGGGVWKTTDGGSNWSPITESLGSLSMGHLAMDPNNHNTLYLGLGDAFDGTGVGLVKSTDAGTTWSSIVFLGDSTNINWIGVSSSNSQIVLAATNAGLYRSTDGGASFAKVSIATGTGVDPYCWTLAWGGGTNWALSLESDQSVSTGSGEIWYSSNDGSTWTKSTGFTQSTVGLARASIASAPTNRQVMYAYAAGAKTWGSTDAASDTADMYRSADGGQTWTSLGTTSGYKSGTKGFTTKYTNTNTDSTYPGKILGGQAWYNQMIIVDPSDAATFYVGGNLNLAKVTSATTTPSYAVLSNWLAQYSQPYIHADFHAGAFGPDGSLYMGTDGGFFKRTSAASNTWSYGLNVGIVSHLCYSVGSSLNNPSAVITGMQDNGTRVRSGSTTTFDQPLGGDGFGSHIHAVDATKMLASLYYGRVYKSTTSGSTGGSFSLASTGITESNNSSTAPFITRITPGLADATGNTVYTYSNGKVYKSTNYAGSWTAMGTTGLPAQGTSSATDPANALYIRNVGAAKSDANVVGIVANQGRVFTTTNGGTSWTQAAALPGISSYTSYISFSPQNASVIYVASVSPTSTANHLWKSTNGGTNWSNLDGASGSSNGFPFGVPVNCALEDPGDSQTIYAGTHEGLYRSTDGGSTWSRFGAGLPLVNVTDLYMAPDSSLLRVSTYGRGIWEFDTKTSTVTASISLPASNITINSGVSVSFTGSAVDADPASILSYGWSFGDSTTATGSSTSHTFFNATGSDVVYTVTFSAIGSTGGSASTTRQITVKGDTTAPSITNLAESGTSGTITFTCNASDNVGVTSLTYSVDGVGWRTSTTPPFSASMPATNLSNGSHTLKAIAYDAVGNRTISSPITFSINNGPDSIPPTITVSETGSTGTLSFLSTVSDNISVVHVDYYVDGIRWRGSSGAPFTATMPSNLIMSGAHKLVGKAFDAAGNVGTSASVTFTVDNGIDTVKPTVTNVGVTSNGTTLTFSCSPSDDHNVVQVTYSIDGVGWRTTYWSPWTASMPITNIPSGNHNLVAVVWDLVGNRVVSSPVPFTTP